MAGFVLPAYLLGKQFIMRLKVAIELAENILYKKQPISDKELAEIIDRIDSSMVFERSPGTKREKLMHDLIDLRKNLDEHNAKAKSHLEEQVKLKPKTKQWEPNLKMEEEIKRVKKNGMVLVVVLVVMLSIVWSLSGNSSSNVKSNTPTPELSVSMPISTQVDTSAGTYQDCMKNVEKEADANMNAVLRLMKKDAARGLPWSKSDIKMATDITMGTMTKLENECRQKYAN